MTDAQRAEIRAALRELNDAIGGIGGMFARYQNEVAQALLPPYMRVYQALDAAGLGFEQPPPPAASHAAVALTEQPEARRPGRTIP